MKKLILLLITILFIQCSSFNKKNDYRRSLGALKSGNITRAIQLLPHKEKGFIVVLEETYLNLLRGEADIDQLISLSHQVDKRVRYKVSKELMNFFYLETPSGYYASEHEVIWMHLLLSWGYSLRKNYDKAYVEAKKSSVLLSNKWSREGRFDDSFLRIMLASVWYMAGYWNEAQVDFKQAYRLNKKLKWALELANLNKPPKDFTLILGGISPEVSWNPSVNINLIRGIRNIQFTNRGRESSLFMKTSNHSQKFKKQKMYITSNSLKWYQRHFERDNAISDIIRDSQYTQKMLSTAIKGTTIIAGGILLGVTVATGGVGLGGGLIFLGLQGSGSGELIGLGVVVAGGGITWGYNIGKNSVKEAEYTMKEDLNVATTYRFVRFLPEYAWVYWGKSNKIDFQKKKKNLFRFINKDNNSVDVHYLRNIGNRVRIGFYPDS